MALNFGKLNFSTSFNPTSAFPLDARCYFESFESAQAAALTAEAAGSSNTVYYFGQQIAVLENSKATLYIIQPKAEGVGGELVEVGSKTLGDDKSINLENGTLSLRDFGKSYYKFIPAVGEVESHYEKVDGFKTGLQPQITSEDGVLVLAWFEPNPTTIEGLSTRIAAVETQIADVAEVVGNENSGLVKNLNDLRNTVNAIPEVTASEQNGYIKVGENAIKVYDDTALTNAVNKKVDAVEGKSLVSNTEITKLAGVSEGANKVESSVQNGYIKIGGVETKVYEEAADVVHDVNYKHITITSSSVSDGTNTFEKYDDTALSERVENLANTKQDILGFEGEYNKESNKVATASYVLAEIGKIKHWSYELVESLPEVAAGEEHKIYLVAKGEGKVGYREYIFLPSIEGVREARFEEIGDTDIDLSNCATKGELSALEGRIKVFEDNKSIYDEAVNKLRTIAEGAQVNVIEKIQVNGVDVNPVEKVVNIAVPTGALASKDNVAEADLEATLANKINNKQDKLTAGNGLVIENNEIKLDEIIFDCGSASDWAPKSE